MEFKKEKLFWIENVADKTTHVETDLDVIVPDSKPDIKKILQIDANVDTTNCEVQNDRVLLCGNVYLNVIYLPDDSTMLQSIRITAPFTDILAVNGVNPDMKCTFNADICSVNYKILNGRKFSVKSEVEVKFKVKNTTWVESVVSVSDKEVQVRNKEIDLLVRSGECNKIININEKIIIPETEPSIGEMLNVSAKVNEHSVKLINNKAIIKGDVKIACTYAEAVNGELTSVNRVVPFTEILDIEGVKADDFCNEQIEAGICEYNCIESQGGEIRSVEIKCILKADIYTFRDDKCSLIDDCYAVDNMMQLTTSKIKMPKRIANVNYNDTLKTSLLINENEPNIERVYDTCSKAYIEMISVENNKMTINGVVDNYILYVTQSEESPIYCVKNEVEFSQNFDCEGSANPEGEFFAEVLSSSYTLSSDNSIELRLNLKVSGIIYNIEELDVITDMQKTETCLPNTAASITVYFVQDNETLWDIAKKYYTTVDDIICINELSETTIKKDMRILIPKCKKV